MVKNRLKKAVVLLLAAAVAVGGSACGQEKKELKIVPSKMPVPEYCNPLTGEAGYSPSRLSARRVAVVVENHPEARPQWSIETPDVIMEAEVEGGITRMLWLYSDFSAVPAKVGPVRSARPSYVKFAKLFDAVYIHWGGSHSRGGYVGGYDTIANEGVDDLDGMAGGALFTRDYSRGKSSEHTGVLLGENLPAALKNAGIRNTVNKSSATSFLFNSKKKVLGKKAEKVDVSFSSSTDTRAFSYNGKDKRYHTSDWGKDVSFDNLIVLMDGTTYISAPYKGGYVSYLNYSFGGGEGYYASSGKIRKISWSVENGKLQLKRADGKKLRLNPGRMYIGLASSNNGGSVSY